MSLATNIASGLTALATAVKQNRVWLTGSSSGDLTGLTTTDKSSVVAAINEVKVSATGSPPDATTSAKGIVELATTGETTTGTDTVRAVTPAGVKAAIDALIAGAPGALDTLNEIATQLASDESAVSALTTTVAGKQPGDADLTAIAALVSAADKLPYATGAGAWALTDFTAAGRALVDDADAAAQRATLSVYSQAQIGDPATDFVAVVTAGLA